MGKIIFFSAVKFDSLKQRHQGIALELAKIGYEVYFVNPINANGFSCRYIQVDSRETFSNFKLLNIEVPFKAVSYPFLQVFSIKLAFKLLKKKLHLNTKEYILWISDPSYSELTKYKWEKIIYDCCDLHGLFPKQKSNVWQYYEEITADNANLISVSHPYIKNHFKLENQKKCFLLPNATFFDSESTFHRRLNNCQKIKMLSSGAHYEWVDFDWLKMLADLDNIELHIAGLGRGKDFANLIKSKNVVFHGKLDENRLLRLIKECDIGLIPFKNIELIKGVDPIKAYDYASLGLEIWATDIEALYSNKFINRYVRDKQSALEAIKGGYVNKVTNAEKIPTWYQRVKSLLPYLQE